MSWGSIFRLGGKLAILGLIIAAAPSHAAQRAAFLQTAGQIGDPIRYRGQQIVFDLPELKGIGPIRHLSVSAQRQDGGFNSLTTSGDSEGRATGILCAQGLPPDAHLIVRITTDSGTWVKWISAIREDDESPSNAVAELWPGINNPEQPCACTTCGDNCTEYNSSLASQDHGVNTNDGTVVTSLAQPLRDPHAGLRLYALPPKRGSLRRRQRRVLLQFLQHEHRPHRPGERADRDSQSAGLPHRPHRLADGRRPPRGLAAPQGDSSRAWSWTPRSTAGGSPTTAAAAWSSCWPKRGCPARCSPSRSPIRTRPASN